jgi:hypothetical protein
MGKGKKGKPMNFWMDVMRHLEPVMDDHERLFDAWAAGGVDGLVVGPMVFEGGTPTFDPNPTVYAAFGVEPPAAPAETLPEKRQGLETALTAAAERGWDVWIFCANYGQGPGGGHIFADPQSRAAFCARMVDTLEHYPMVEGAIMDGPEWGYEMAPHHLNHRSFFFHDLPESVAGKCAELGYDYPALVAAKDRLFERLHQLTPRDVRLHAPGGLVGAFRLFGADPDVLAWFRFRVEAMTDFYRGVRADIDGATSRPVKLGLGPRSACFAPLCGYDFAELAEVIDVLLPKHYIWHRGFDGLYGTACRYVETLTAWNPGLSDADALAVVSALFGLELPGVADRRDFDRGFPPEFFDRIVTQETRRALAVVDHPHRIVPWVDSGRKPHDGDPVGAPDLRRLLLAAQEAGLRRFLYHHHENLTAGEWAVLSELCGTAWEPLKSEYNPPDWPVL